MSPSDADGDETLSTLRYAARARCIKNKPIVNEDPKDALLRQYQIELQRLRKLLESSDQNPRLDLNSPEKDNDNNSRNNEEIINLRRECENSNNSAQKLKEELSALRLRFESEPIKEMNYLNLEEKRVELLNDRERRADDDEVDPLEEKRRRKREAARLEVLKRLEKLTIGGEARSNDELRRRRERRRKRLEILATALEADSQEGTGAAFQVYGQLKTAEEALKRMAKRARQLEIEAADLQVNEFSYF